MAAYSSSRLPTGGELMSTSLSDMPNPAMWLCASWNPGSTVAPRRSTTRAARDGSASSASIRPPAMATAEARGRAAGSGSKVSTLALTSTRSVTWAPRYWPASRAVIGVLASR